MPTKPKIVVINTGGTISMEQEIHGRGVGQADPRKLQSVIPTVASFAQVEMQHLLDKPSPHLTLQDLYQLAQQVTVQLERDDVAGIVITHGTDTLEETAYYLHLTIPSNKPVVITGAMRSHNEIGADGPRNILQAVRVASHSEAKNRGTLIVFHDEIHHAQTVTKVHTSQPSTFQSPGTGPVGIISNQQVAFFHNTKREPLIPLVQPTADVALVKAVIGMSDRLIHALVEQSIDGLVIEALGQGNLPPTVLPACQRALKNGIPILLVSRCLEGWVEGVYNYEGGGKQLIEQGFVFCRGLNGPKARIKLILARSAQKAISNYQPFYTK